MLPYADTMMRRFLTALGTTTLLAAVLTGCTQLVPESGAPTAQPSADAAPEPSTEPSALAAPDPLDALDAAPESVELTPFTTYPARPTSKAILDSITDDFTAGKHPLGQAIPGSEDVVLSERFVGPHEFSIPAIAPGKSLAWSISCLGGGDVSVEISNAGSFTYGSMVNCSPSLSWGTMDGIPGKILTRIQVDRDTEVHLDLVTYDQLKLMDDDAELLASLGLMDGVVTDSFTSLADIEFTGANTLALPDPRSGTQLMAMTSCPIRTLATLQLEAADGSRIGDPSTTDCMSGDASATVHWEDPDPTDALGITIDIEPTTTMRLRVFGYDTE